MGVSRACSIGKTEVMAHACKRILKSSNECHNFIWVEGLHEKDTKKLQMKIANKIGVSL